MAQGDIFRATAQFAMPQGTIAQWVWHYVQSSTGDPALSLVVAAIATALEAAFLNMDQYIVPEVQGETLELAVYDSAAGVFDTVRSEDISDIQGSSVNQMLPHQDAAVVKMYTNVGRSIGKKFIMGMDENGQDESVIVSAYLSAFALFAADLDDDVTGGGVTLTPGNFARATGNFREYNGTVEALATVGSCDRRRPGTGI